MQRLRDGLSKASEALKESPGALMRRASLSTPTSSSGGGDKQRLLRRASLDTPTRKKEGMRGGGAEETGEAEGRGLSDQESVDKLAKLEEIYTEEVRVTNQP